MTALTIGQHVRIAREAKNWSQKTLARKLDAHQSQVSALETGRRVSPLERAEMERIAALLECPGLLEPHPTEAELLQAELDRIYEGSDSTRPAPGVRRTAGQLLARILADSPMQRLARLQIYIDAVEDALRCEVEHHDAELQHQRDRIAGLEAEVARLRAGRYDPAAVTE